MSIYLGDTPITGATGANKDLSNLSSTGKNIANWSNNVTNCITEIPQDIKLELNNGILTLKAGSKVYVPNGSGVFDTVTIASDVSATNTYTGTAFVFYNNNSIFLEDTSLISSGTTPPNNGTFYNTSDNTVKRYVSGAVSLTNISFPIAIVTCAGAISSIDQVFNGFGYIGSTVFALPGVKGLIPNGRNEDGSLKNSEFETSSVLTKTVISAGTRSICFAINTDGVIDFNPFVWSETQPSGNYKLWYKESENILYSTFTGTPYNVNMCLFTDTHFNSDKIDWFNPKTSYHALDYNDSSTISGWSMPSSRFINLTLGATGATYIAPANGWFTINKHGTDGQLAAFDNITAGGVTWISCLGRETDCRVSCPAKKGDNVKLWYNATGTTSVFRFVYAEGEN